MARNIFEIRDPRFKDVVLEHHKPPFHPDSYIGAYDNLQKFINDLRENTYLARQFFADIEKILDADETTSKEYAQEIVTHAESLFCLIDHFAGEWNLIYEASEDKKREENGQAPWYSHNLMLQWERERKEQRAKEKKEGNHG